MCNQLSLSIICHTASILEDRASVWTCATQQHCLHTAVCFLKKIKNTTMNGLKFFVSGQQVQTWGIVVVAGLGFLVLIMSNMYLKAGVAQAI